MRIDDNGVRKMLFSIEEIERVLKLIKERKWPNGDYGDDECILWSKIIDELGLRSEFD